MKKIVLKISGMTCSACSSGLEKYLSKQKGIISASVNLVLSLATVEYDSISVKTIEKYISEAGFKSLGEFKRIDELESNLKIYENRSKLADLLKLNDIEKIKKGINKILD